MSTKPVSTKNYYQRIHQLCVGHTVEYFGNTGSSEIFIPYHRCFSKINILMMLWDKIK